jgi:hypothetical protein
LDFGDLKNGKKMVVKLSFFESLKQKRKNNGIGGIEMIMQISFAN